MEKILSIEEIKELKNIVLEKIEGYNAVLKKLEEIEAMMEAVGCNVSAFPHFFKSIQLDCAGDGKYENV